MKVAIVQQRKNNCKGRKWDGESNIQRGRGRRVGEGSGKKGKCIEMSE